MKLKFVVAALIAVMGTSAYATPPHSNNGNGQTTNNNTAHGGAGVGTGVGVGVGVGLGQGGKGGNADVRNHNRNTNAQGQMQGQLQGQIQGQRMEGSNNSTVAVSGDTFTYEEAASSVFAAPIPTVATSCRLYLFAGGTNVSGAVSGTLPLGNDQTCLSGNNMNNMMRINKIAPGTFSNDDIVGQACKVEGMDKTKTCKELYKKVARESGYEGNDEIVIQRMNK